jgi:ribokinase
MTLWNLGSINADHVYSLSQLPQAGETLAAYSFVTGLGGKGANMSVAASRTGGDVRHIGAVGNNGAWAVNRLQAYGVDTQHVALLDAPTGNAVIALNGQAENFIITYPGANRLLSWDVVEAALSAARPGDWFLMQNETNLQEEAARSASDRGLTVAYASAPFDVAAVRAVLPHTDLLVLNAVEAEQLRAATGQGLADLGIHDLVVTLGAAGCLWLHDGVETRAPAPSVRAVDTTGAGDTLTGYLLALLDAGRPMVTALALAISAASLKVTRAGAADAIPSLNEMLNFNKAVDRGRGVDHHS